MVFLLKGGLYQRMLLRYCWVGACGLRWRFLRGLCFFRRWWCCRRRRRSRVLCLGGLGWWMDRTLRCRNRWTWSVVCFQWIWNSWLQLWYFFHWLKLRFFAIVLLMRSRIFLPILPISDFVELMSLQVGLFAKFCLWSLSVMNGSLSVVVSTLSSIPSFVAMPLFSLWIIWVVWDSAFL